MPGALRLDADRVGGLIWLALGLAIVVGSWLMDRLPALGINPLTAPGLLPGLVGLGIVAFALVLLLRRSQAATAAERATTAEPAVPAEPSGQAAAPEDARRLALSWLLCLAFAGLLLGRGLPFWLLAAAFVFLHVVLLDDADRIAGRPLARRAAVAAAVAVGASAAVTMVFQDLFLIRLP